VHLPCFPCMLDVLFVSSFVSSHGGHIFVK
jgi:hypothetical protein